MAFLEKYIHPFQDWIHSLSDEEKKRVVLFCTAGVAVILVLSVLLSLKSPKKENVQAQRTGVIIAISPDEIFLPDEPDFIPGVLPEREQRSSWTEEDAALFWQDPLKYGEEHWRENIEEAIEKFLERVP
jgi:hypothetical protein